jgi:hypothetical protein
VSTPDDKGQLKTSGCLSGYWYAWVEAEKYIEEISLRRAAKKEFIETKNGFRQLLPKSARRRSFRRPRGWRTRGDSRDRGG